MVDFPTLTDDELAQLARDYLSFHAGLFGVSLDVGDGSDADMTARLLASLQSMAQRQTTAVMSAANPIKSFGAFLREHATCYGIGPDFASVGVDAVAATGYAIVVCTTGSAVVPSGLVLRAPDGQTYVTTFGATAPAAAGGLVLPGWRYGESRRCFTVGTGNAPAVSTTFTPAMGHVLTASPSGELCAVLEAVGSVDGAQHDRFELYNDLASLPTSFARALAVVVPITAQSAGRAGNRDPKSALVVQSPPAGVSSSAYVLYCDGGRDAMTQAEMRTQLRDLFGLRQGMGTPSEIRDLALETPRAFVDNVFVLPGYRGVCSYNLRPVSSFGRAVSANRASIVGTATEARLARGLSVRSEGLAELNAELTTIDVDCAVGYGPDWQVQNSTGTMAAVVKSVAGAQTDVLISGITDLSLLPRVGDRVLLTIMTSGLPAVQKRGVLYHARVAAVGALTSGNSLITIDAVINYYNFVATITPGGPLGDAVVSAIVSSYDNRAPSAPTAPLVVFPDLEASTNQGALTRAISVVPGVVDVSVSADASYSMTGGEVWQLGTTIVKMHAS